jgi:pimeloyl-ACP methyl ester carboxylesterase
MNFARYLHRGHQRNIPHLVAKFLDIQDGVFILHPTKRKFLSKYQYFQQQKGLAEAMIKGNEDIWIRWCFGKSGRDGKISEETIQEYIRCYKIENTPATGASYYRAMRHDMKRWMELGGRKLTMPSLYIYGNKDMVIIPEYLNHIEDCFDQLEVKQVDADHFLQEEKPEIVAKLLNDFLL